MAGRQARWSNQVITRLQMVDPEPSTSMVRTDTGRPCPRISLAKLLCCASGLLENAKSHFAAALSGNAPLGRPVFRLGTAPSAARNAFSPIEFRAPMPARISSLFFVGRASIAARNFRDSRTRYSDFGIVKLSRTSLSFALAAVCAAATSGFAADFGATLAGGGASVLAGAALLADVGLEGAIGLGFLAVLVVVMYFLSIANTVYTVYTDSAGVATKVDFANVSASFSQEADE
jgi:hypothetical protein